MFLDLQWLQSYRSSKFELHKSVNLLHTEYFVQTEVATTVAYHSVRQNGQLHNHRALLPGGKMMAR